MKNLTLSSASCKNNPEQCARSAVSPSYLLKHQLWTWFPGLCLFGDCRLPLPPSQAAARVFVEVQSPLARSFSPGRAVRPSVSKNRKERLRESELRTRGWYAEGSSACTIRNWDLQAGAPIALAPNSFHLSNTLKKYSPSYFTPFLSLSTPFKR